MKQTTNERADTAGVLLQALAIVGRGEFDAREPVLAGAIADLEGAGFVVSERIGDRLIVTLLMRDRPATE
jgi:hypothetical protein